MWLPVVITTLPTEEPLTLSEVKDQCRVDFTDDDGFLLSQIIGARELVEQYLGSRLVTQTAVLRASSFDDLALLPVAPVQSISSITYLDSAGVEQTLSTAIYESVLIGLQPSIRLKYSQSWPALRDVSDAVRVTAVLGYGDADDVPTPIKQAMLLTIANLYDNRETGGLPDSAHSLLANYRIF